MNENKFPSRMMPRFERSNQLGNGLFGWQTRILETAELLMQTICLTPSIMFTPM